MRTRNCKKIKKEYDTRAIRILIMTKHYPPYYEEGWTFRCGLWPHKYRSYKTWKHNRSKQFKES